jgi:hypothetical protein
MNQKGPMSFDTCQSSGEEYLTALAETCSSLPDRRIFLLEKVVEVTRI